MVIGGRRLIAAGLGVVFLAGCAGVGLLGVGVPGPFWQRAAQEQPGTDALVEALGDLATDEAQPSPSRWQGELETAASARLALFNPAPFPGRPSQEERWRCEVLWRCYDTDDDTGERTELIDSGTAWYEDAGLPELGLQSSQGSAIGRQPVQHRPSGLLRTREGRRVLLLAGWPEAVWRSLRHRCSERSGTGRLRDE